MAKRPRWQQGNGKSAFYQRSLGQTFLNYEYEVVLELGDVKVTRMELAQRYGCCHLSAARRLSNNLALHDITSINKLHATPPDELMALAGVGTIQLFVVMCLLDQHQFDAEQWYSPTVTATTLQARAKKQAALAREKGPGRRKRAVT